MPVTFLPTFCARKHKHTKAHFLGQLKGVSGSKHRVISGYLSSITETLSIQAF